MPPEREMVPKHYPVLPERMALHDAYPSEVRELIHEYGLRKTLDALRDAGGIAVQARFILEERVGPPLVPRRRRV